MSVFLVARQSDGTVLYSKYSQIKNNRESLRTDAIGLGVLSYFQPFYSKVVK